MSIARAKSYLKDGLFKVFILALFVILPKQVVSLGHNWLEWLLFLQGLEYLEHIGPKRHILLRSVLLFELPIKRNGTVYLRLIDYFEVVFLGHVEQAIRAIVE